MAFAGANPNNKPVLEESSIRLISLLDAHLAQRAYIFGGRPAFGGCRSPSTPGASALARPLIHPYSLALCHCLEDRFPSCSCPS